jgi:predicted nucleotidyltransferase
MKTVQDYDNAIRDFLSDLDQLGDDVASVLLYGSVAREDVVPGESDLMDAHVFLRNEVFQDKDRFLRSLEVMVEACGRLSQTGLPFHPWHYFSLDEAVLSPAMYLPTWHSDRTSKVLKGEDIRPRISSTETSHAVAATSFFNARRTTAHLLAFYLSKKEWSADDEQKVKHRLASLKKHICIMGCFALGIPAEASEAVAKLRERLPSLDIAVLYAIDSLRNETGAPPQEPRALRQVLRDALMFVEHLHDEIVAAT